LEEISVQYNTNIINAWNSLPESVISASTKLDKFWRNQEISFDYKAELTGIGSRSFINNFDDNIHIV